MSSLSIAFRNLRRRRARTALTVSGIVVGVSLIMVLFSLTAGTSTQASGLIRNILPAQITVVNATVTTAAQGGGGAGFRSLFGPSSAVNESLATTIEGITGVYAASPQLSSTGYVDGTNAFIYGIDPSTYSSVTGGLNVVSGTGLSASGADQVVLGQDFAQTLGVNTGSTVTIGPNSTGGRAYTVIGVYSSGNRFLDRSAYISLAEAQSVAGEQGKATEIFVKVNSDANVTQVAAEITAQVAGVRVVSASNLAASASSLSGTLTSFFTVIGLVALLAGAFGVINTMMISVSERTREIGTLKAIGARRSQILSLFLSEAFLIGLIGGVAGVLIGAVVTYAIPSFTGAASGSRFGGAGVGGLFRGALTPTLTPETVLLSLVLGIGVGVLAGLYPAWRASRMDPAEALRHV